MSKQIYEVIRVTEKGGVDRKNYVSSFRRAQGTKALLVDECEKDSIDAAVIILDGNYQIVEMSLTGEYASQNGNMNAHKDETKAGDKITRVAKHVKEYLKSSLKKMVQYDRNSESHYSQKYKRSERNKK